MADKTYQDETRRFENNQPIKQYDNQRDRELAAAARRAAQDKQNNNNK